MHEKLSADAAKSTCVLDAAQCFDQFDIFTRSGDSLGTLTVVCLLNVGTKKLAPSKSLHTATASLKHPATLLSNSD